jgi:hypothetical protein
MVCGVLVLGDGCVLVEAKDLGVRVRWQVLDVLDIAIVVRELGSVVDA